MRKDMVRLTRNLRPVILLQKGHKEDILIPQWCGAIRCVGGVFTCAGLGKLQLTKTATVFRFREYYTTETSKCQQELSKY